MLKNPFYLGFEMVKKMYHTIVSLLAKYTSLLSLPHYFIVQYIMHMKLADGPCNNCPMGINRKTAF